MYPCWPARSLAAPRSPRSPTTVSARRWSESRLAMTHELVERVTGHRTRLAQEVPQRWHRGRRSQSRGIPGPVFGTRHVVAEAAGRVPRGWITIARRHSRPGVREPGRRRTGSPSAWEASCWRRSRSAVLPTACRSSPVPRSPGSRHARSSRLPRDRPSAIGHRRMTHRGGRAPDGGGPRCPRRELPVSGPAGAGAPRVHVARGRGGASAAARAIRRRQVDVRVDRGRAAEAQDSGLVLVRRARSAHASARTAGDGGWSRRRSFTRITCSARPSPSIC